MVAVRFTRNAGLRRHTAAALVTANFTIHDVVDTLVRRINSFSMREITPLRVFVQTVVTVGALLMVHATVAWGVAQSSQPASQPAVDLSANSPTLDALVQQLGSDDFGLREEATRKLIARGSGIEAYINDQLQKAIDIEVVYRLRHIRENIVAPPLAVLVVRADPETRLEPGDIITHLAARRVRSESEFAQRLSGFPQGGMVRVIGRDGPVDRGPVHLEQFDDLRDYVAPHGEPLARILRLFADGYALDAYSLLMQQPASATNEWSAALSARIAFCAGQATRAFEMISADSGAARPQPNREGGGPWSAPSGLDLAGPGKAPYHMELRLLTEGGNDAFASEGEPDLRVQRVLVPARRFLDALARSAELWTTRYGDTLGSSGDRSYTVAGNQLAVASWMLSSLGLRSECCRLIEPRSKILRKSDGPGYGWVRVDLTAWLPFIAGDTQGAINSSYEAALDVLKQPPAAGARDAIIRNPRVGARIAFFLFQHPDDRRIEEMIAAVSTPGHPAVDEFVRWMLLALGENNESQIRRHLLELLPKLPDASIEPFARAAALLEYVREKPDAEVLSAARQRLFQTTPGEQRDLWLAIVDALIALQAGRPSDAQNALATMQNMPETAAILSTAAFLKDPPPTAANFPELAKTRLAVPVGQTGDAWIILDASRQLQHFDAKGGRLVPIPKPDPGWFPRPQAWPWLSRELSSGRVWTYSRRRVIELSPHVAKPVRFNINAEDIAEFDRSAAPFFSTLADALASIPPPQGENSEFLRSELKANGDCVADPDLHELGWIEPLTHNPRFVQGAFRGGPQWLLDTRAQKLWSSVWVARELGLPRPPMFFAQALLPNAIVGQSLKTKAADTILLFSEQGLIRFDAATEKLTRLPLPIEPSAPPLIPEDVPYDRRDPAYAYFAVLPEAGGRVFRYVVESGAVEAVDLINESLPRHYFDSRTRSEIRAEIDRHFRGKDIGTLEEFLRQAIEAVTNWDTGQG